MYDFDYYTPNSSLAGSIVWTISNNWRNSSICFICSEEG